MRPARFIRVSVLGDAAAVDDDVAAMVEVKPMLFRQTDTDEAEIHDVPATMRAINPFTFGVKEGEEYECIQDISGHWVLAGGSPDVYPATEIVAEIVHSLKSTDTTGVATYKYSRSVQPFTGDPAGIGEDDEVSFVNPYDLDAMCDSLINLRRKRKQDGAEEWVIIEAKRRKARRIMFTFDPEESHVSVSAFWEGEDPSECGTVDVTYPLGQPCEEAVVIAFYDPRTDTYVAQDTKASMMGDPEDVDTVQAMAFDGCGINYMKQSIKAFPCGSEPSLINTSPTMQEVLAVTGVQETASALAFSFTSIMVCTAQPSSGKVFIPIDDCEPPEPPACGDYCRYEWLPDEGAETFSWQQTGFCSGDCECVTSSGDFPAPGAGDPLIKEFPCVEPEEEP